MNHEQIKDKIDEYYDGELTSEDARFFKAHLNSCSECRHELTEWEKTSNLFLRSHAPVMDTEHFVTRVMARIPQEEYPVKGMFASFLKLGFALAGFLVVVWSYLSMSTGSSDSIETLLIADSRAATVSNWVIRDESIPSDEFARYTLEE